MRVIFRFFLSMVFLPVVVFAAGGVTMQYGADVANLRDGDVFYADRHYRAPLDTIKKTVNGLLGNSNLAADAKIAVTKLDSTGRLSMDSVIANKGIRTSGVARVDSLAATKGVSGTYGRFSGALSGTTLTASSTATVDSLKSTKGITSSTITTTGTAYVDSLASSKGVSGTYGRFSGALSGTTLTASSTATVDSLKSTRGAYFGGVVGVGSTTPTQLLHMYKTGGTSQGLLVEHGNTSGQSFVELRRHRSPSEGGTAAVVAGDVLGTFYMSGADGTTQGVGGSFIRSTVEGTVSAGVVPSYLSFHNTAPGATVPSEYMRITADGAIRPAAIATPASPAASAMQMYFKGSRFILQYNDGGTVRWKYLDLAGTGVTWVHTTTAP